MEIQSALSDTWYLLFLFSTNTPSSIYTISLDEWMLWGEIYFVHLFWFFLGTSMMCLCTLKMKLHNNQLSCSFWIFVEVNYGYAWNLSYHRPQGSSCIDFNPRLCFLQHFLERVKTGHWWRPSVLQNIWTMKQVFFPISSFSFHIASDLKFHRMKCIPFYLLPFFFFFLEFSLFWCFSSLNVLTA